MKPTEILAMIAKELKHEKQENPSWPRDPRYAVTVVSENLRNAAFAADECSNGKIAEENLKRSLAKTAATAIRALMNL